MIPPPDERVLEAARSYLGVKYRHQGRVRAGVDCLGLVVLAAKDTGRETPDRVDYSYQPDGHLLRGTLQEHLIEVPIEERAPGDVLLFWFAQRGYPQHVGICNGEGMIHTHLKIGRVVEFRFMDKFWLRRLDSAYRWQPQS